MGVVHLIDNVCVPMDILRINGCPLMKPGDGPRVGLSHARHVNNGLDHVPLSIGSSHGQFPFYNPLRRYGTFRPARIGLCKSDDVHFGLSAGGHCL